MLDSLSNGNFLLLIFLLYLRKRIFLFETKQRCYEDLSEKRVGLG